MTALAVFVTWAIIDRHPLTGLERRGDWSGANRNAVEVVHSSRNSGVRSPLLGIQEHASSGGLHRWLALAFDWEERRLLPPRGRTSTLRLARPSRQHHGRDRGWPAGCADRKEADTGLMGARWRGDAHGDGAAHDRGRYRRGDLCRLGGARMITRLRGEAAMPSMLRAIGAYIARWAGKPLGRNPTLRQTIKMNNLAP